MTSCVPCLFPGVCPEVLARQRAVAAHLLDVLEDLDRAHEEFQQRP
jgi:RAS protein activator-like 1